MRGRGYSRLPAKIVSAFAQRAAVPSPLQRGMYVFGQGSSLHLTCPRTGPCSDRSKTDGAAIWATLWPRSRGFRGFCLPLAGGFKGWWWRPAGAILLYIVMVLDAPSFREYSRQSAVGGKRIGQRTAETSPPPSFRAKPRNLPPATCFNGLTVKHITFLRPLAITSWWDYGCLAMGQCLYRKA